MADNGLFLLWNDLSRHEDSLSRGGRGSNTYGPRLYDSFGRPLLSRSQGSSQWDIGNTRVQRLREALRSSGHQAKQMIARSLAGIDLSTIWDILIEAVKDIALYYGASVVVGTAVGAFAGAFAGGAGAVPGAVAGAAAGATIGGWVLALLGLKSLVEGLSRDIPDALDWYEKGFREAWGATHWDRGGLQIRKPRFTPSDNTDPYQAGWYFANGHVLIITSLLSVMVAYLTRGRGDKAMMMQEVRQSSRLGPRVADWLEQNEEKLCSHPHLKPRESRGAAASPEEPLQPVRENKPEASKNHREKAAFGEAKAHEYMKDNGLEKISRDKGVFEKGVDGIYKNTNPPPDYVIAEAKYGSSRLGNTLDGKQMSDDWVNGTKTGFDRIKDAVGEREARNIKNAIESGNAEKWLLNVDASGDVTKRVLDTAGNVLTK